MWGKKDGAGPMDQVMQPFLHPTSLALEPSLLAPTDQLDLQSRASCPRSGRGNEEVSKHGA